MNGRLWKIDAAGGSVATLLTVLYLLRPTWLAARYERLQASLEVATRKEHSALALQTAQTDVCPEADHPPLVAATRMWLAQSDHVSESKLDDHRSGSAGQAHRVA